MNQALITILCTIAASALTWIGSRAYHNGIKIKNEHATLVGMSEQFDDLMKDHKALMKSQRDQIKNSIVRICDEAFNQGFVTMAQMESLTSNFSSYEKLGGNSYISVMVKKACALPINGDHYPLEVRAQIEEYGRKDEDND